MVTRIRDKTGNPKKFRHSLIEKYAHHPCETFFTPRSRLHEIFYPLSGPISKARSDTSPASIARPSRSVACGPRHARSTGCESSHMTVHSH